MPLGCIKKWVLMWEVVKECGKRENMEVTLC